MSQENPTVGESRVRISFNPSSNESVDKIKRAAADLIDLCESLKDENREHPKNRALAVAMTEVESAAMWAVKGATA